MAKPDKVENFLNGVRYWLLGITCLLIGTFTALALFLICYDMMGYLV
jgi:hypothetical protein